MSKYDTCTCGNRKWSAAAICNTCRTAARKAARETCARCKAAPRHKSRAYCLPCERAARTEHARREAAAQAHVTISSASRAPDRDGVEIDDSPIAGAELLAPLTAFERRHGKGRCWLPCCAPEKRGTPRTPAERWAHLRRNMVARARAHTRAWLESPEGGFRDKPL